MTLRSIVSYFDRWTYVGVSEEMDPAESIRLRTTNLIAIILCFLSLFNAAWAYVLGSSVGAMLIVFLGATYSLTLVWTHLKCHMGAKIWIVLVANISIEIGKVFFGSDAGIHYLYFPFVAIPFLLFSNSQWVAIALSLLLPVATMTLTIFHTGYLPVNWHGDSGIPPAQMYTFHSLIIFNSLLMTMGFLGYSSVILRRYEARLARSMEQVTTAYGLVVHDAVHCVTTISQTLEKLGLVIQGTNHGSELLKTLSLTVIRLEALFATLSDYLMIDGSRSTFLAGGSLRLEDVFAEVLGQRVEQRTFDLENANRALIIQREELRLSRINAESANLAKSDFLASMSHELRTPLGIMIGYAELLQNNQVDTVKSAVSAQKILANGKHLLGLLNEILDLSKVESGRLEVESVKLESLTFLHDIEGLFQQTALTKNIAFQVQMVGKLPQYFQSDEVRLRQILINIVGNALKFTNQGSVLAQISYRATADGRGDLIFSVSDTGCGIASENHTRIFEPFTQAEQYISRNYGGTGLGLGLARKISRKLGGDVVLKSSQLGLGSVFEVFVDAGELDSDVVWVGAEEFAASVLSPSEVLAKNISRPLGHQLQGLQILVVEDHPDNQNLIRIILESEGAVVSIAGNGEEGVQKALADKFDVILMDLQMPVMDGYQAVASLRSLGYEGPIIEVSAHAMRAERDRCLQIGCQGFVSKPIDRARLVQSIRGVLPNLFPPGNPT